MSSHPSRKPRVAVVFGGRSSEHAVSCATAAGVLRAIDREVYDVVPVGITREGAWVLAEDDPEALVLNAEQTPEVTDTGTSVLLPRKVGETSLSGHRAGQALEGLGEVDVVFPLLHGPYGEDGTLQGMLELVDIRYVGSGVLASAAGMDKHYMKVIFAGAGLPVGPYTVITDAQWRRDKAAAMDAVSALSFPVFVKPCRAGSSMGVAKVDEPAGLEAAIEAAREHDLKVIVEQGIVGREIECAVLEGRGLDAPRTSLPGEIVLESGHGHDFYDFEAKYLDGGSVVLSCPVDLPAKVTEEVRRLAAAAFESLACEGLARVDSFVTEAGQVVINEINTMPGFTPNSMYPRMWQESGVNYPELVGELIELALERPVGLR